MKVKADGYQPVMDGPFTVTESDSDPHPETDVGTFTLEPIVPAP